MALNDNLDVISQPITESANSFAYMQMVYSYVYVQLHCRFQFKRLPTIDLDKFAVKIISYPIPPLKISLAKFIVQ